MPLIRRTQPEPEEPSPQKSEGPPPASAQPGAARVVGDTAGHIQQIISAAERAAANIKADAVADAERYAERRRLDADEAVAEHRRAAEELAAEQARALGEVAETLTTKVSVLEAQLGAIVAELHEAVGRLQAGSAISAPTSKPRESTVPPEAGSAKVFSYGKPSAGAREAPGAAGSSTPRSIRPVASRSDQQRETALLRATQMAVAGSGRGEIETALKKELGIRDPGSILDQVIGAD